MTTWWVERGELVGIVTPLGRIRATYQPDLPPLNEGAPPERPRRSRLAAWLQEHAAASSAAPAPRVQVEQLDLGLGR